MKMLTIRFIDEPGIVSRLITWTTDSLWCHTEALSRDGQSWIGAHAGTGVQARPLDWTAVSRERRYTIPVADDVYDRAMTWLESKLGCPYDYTDIAGIALHKRIFARHRVICSTLMFELLLAANIVALNAQAGFSYLIAPETLHLSPIFFGRCTYSFPQVPPCPDPKRPSA